MIKVIGNGRRIIQRMAEFKDMYKIVQYGCSLDVDELMALKDNHEGLAARNLAHAYIKQLKWYHRKPIEAKLAKIIFAAHKDKKYFTTLGDEKKGIYFDVSTKGLHLIGKKFYIFRVGLWDEALKDYDSLRIALFGGGVGAFIIGILTVVIKL
jgi:hypothetical protein